MATYTPLQSITLTSSSASITFSNIDQNYTDLRLVFSGTSTRVASSDVVYLSINGETLGTNGRYLNFYGTGSAAGTGFSGSYNILGIIDGTTGWGQSSGTLDLFNYSNSTTFKTSLARTGASDFVHSCVNSWRQTTPINSIRIWTNIGLFAAGTTVDLYGIKSGSPKAIGGQIFRDATYYYHVFKESGLFTTTTSVTADFLVIAGGGAGGAGSAGGGGAGGLVYTASQSLTLDRDYAVTVGGGGVRASTYAMGTNGTNSNVTGHSLALTAAVGGGAGASVNGIGAGGNGGSGGGGHHYVYSGGTGTVGQGNNGGTTPTYTNDFFTASGGGGAGAAGGIGTKGNGAVSGIGGAGSSAYSSWGSATGTGQNVSGTYWYAGGGSGGALSNNYTSTSGVAGNGGGGRGGGGTPFYGIAGTANTGGGGGGGDYSGYAYPGGNGGSGIVIVRYAI
jgi:hypothetical protein